jgi:hypothetical protein
MSQTTSQAREQVAHADLRGANVIISSYSQTPVDTAGFWIVNGSVVVVPAAAPPEELGKAVLGALAESKRDVPVPDWSSADVFRPILDAAGVRGLPTYMRGTKSVSIVRHREGLELVPMQNGGARGPQRGFHELLDAVERVASDTRDAELGEAVRRAFDRAQ